MRFSIVALLALVDILPGASRAFAEELLYVQPLGEYTRTAERNAEARRELDQYSRASRLPLLKEGNADEIRIWATWANFRANAIGYETVGYVFFGNGARSCRIKYPRHRRTPFTGICARLKAKATQPPSASEIEALAKLSGLELNCDVVDGYWLEIDGVYKGHLFALGSSNPDKCLDEGSKVVAEIMAHVSR
jgi:hypothetical protein